MWFKRVCVLLFGVGVSVAALSAVIFGPVGAATEIACPDYDPSYSITAVDLVPPSVAYTDSCDILMLHPLLAVGTLLVGGGLAVGLVGLLGERSTAG